MTPEIASALGSLVAAAVAIVALIVAIYAAVVARSSAKSARESADAAKRQVDIALRGYKIQAGLDVDLNLTVTRREKERSHNNLLGKGISLRIDLQRRGGPPIVYWRHVTKATFVLSNGASLQVEGNSSWSPEIERKNTVWLFADRLDVLTSLVHVTLEYADIDDPFSLTDETPIWKFKRDLYWTPETLGPRVEKPPPLDPAE